MADPYIGEIRMVAFNYAPQGWALCNGQLLLISQFSALYALLGAQFGGNGTSNFGLPNLQSRVPIHQGQGTGLSSYTMGQSGGVESVPLTTQQMPPHNHAIVVNGTAGSATGSNAAGAYLGNSTPGRGGGTAYNIFATSADNSTMAPGSVGIAGGGLPHPNIQPYQVVNFIIALQGIYPPRQ